MLLFIFLVMQIFIQSVDKTVHCYNVDARNSIRSLIHICSLVESPAYDILFIFNGQILRKELSFDYYGIKNDSKIITFLKKNNVENSQPSTEEPQQKAQKKPMSQKRIEIMERIKAEDRFFSNWESSRVLPKILRESMNITTQRENSQIDQHHTIIPTTSELSTTQLPFFHQSSLQEAPLNRRQKTVH